MRTQLPLQKGGTAPPPIFGPCLFWPNGWCTIIQLGTKVGLGSGDIVLDGARLPLPKKGVPPPILGPCLLWPNGRPSQLLLSSCKSSEITARNTYTVFHKKTGTFFNSYCSAGRGCRDLEGPGCGPYVRGRPALHPST